MSRIKNKFTRKGRGKGALLSTGFGDNPIVESKGSSSGDWLDDKVSALKTKKTLGLRTNKAKKRHIRDFKSKEFNAIIGTQKNPVGVFSDIKLEGNNRIITQDTKIGNKPFQLDTLVFVDPESKIRFQIIDIDRTTKYLDRRTAYIMIDKVQGTIVITEFNKDLELLERNHFQIGKQLAGQGDDFGKGDKIGDTALAPDLKGDEIKIAIIEGNILNSTTKQTSSIYKNMSPTNKELIRPVARKYGAKIESNPVKTMNNIRKEMLSKKAKDVKKGIFDDRTGYYNIKSEKGDVYQWYNDTSTRLPILVATNNRRLNLNLWDEKDHKEFKQLVGKEFDISVKSFDVAFGKMKTFHN